MEDFTKYNKLNNLFAVPFIPIAYIGRIENRVQITNGTAAVNTDECFVTKVGHWGNPRRHKHSDEAAASEVQVRRTAANCGSTIEKAAMVTVFQSVSIAV